MNLQDAHRGIHKHKKLKRVGRGPGSGHGKTCGRGHKGQGQLAGWTAHPGFEGGQLPIYRRVPKRGFNNRWGQRVHTINLGALEKLFESGSEVTLEKLRATDIAKKRFDVLKILGSGKLTKKLKIEAHAFSRSAIEKIQQAGGEAVVLPGPAPVTKNKQGSAGGESTS